MRCRSWLDRVWIEAVPTVANADLQSRIDAPCHSIVKSETEGPGQRRRLPEWRPERGRPLPRLIVRGTMVRIRLPIPESS